MLISIRKNSATLKNSGTVLAGLLIFYGASACSTDKPAYEAALQSGDRRNMDGTYLIEVCDKKCKITPTSKKVIGKLIIDSSGQMLSGESEALKLLVRSETGTPSAEYCYYFPEDSPGQHGTTLQLDPIGFGNIDWLADRAKLTFLNDSPDFRFLSNVVLRGERLLGDWAQSYAGDGGTETKFPQAQLVARRIGRSDSKICTEALKNTNARASKAFATNSIRLPVSQGTRAWRTHRRRSHLNRIKEACRAEPAKQIPPYRHNSRRNRLRRFRPTVLFLALALETLPPGGMAPVRVAPGFGAFRGFRGVGGEHGA